MTATLSSSGSLTPLPYYAPAVTAAEPVVSRGRFLTTRWDMVHAAAAKSGEALETLCRDYWRPIYAFVRRAGHDPHSAQDLTQEFFSRLLTGSGTASADPRRGRFRSWLLGALKHFLANEWHRARTQKRGGGQVIFSIDQARAEDCRDIEPADRESPDRLFDRRWAEELLARVNARVRADYKAAGWEDRYEALKIYLLGGFEPLSYAETAAALGLTESAVKSAIYKLRQRFGQVLRTEIGQTVSNASEVEDEFRHLLDALSR